MIQHDVLIVGGGLAGLRAAVGLARHWDVAVLSKVHPVRSHSGAAQGGINAALGNAPDGRDDSPERHAFDTVKGSDYLADQPAVLTDVPAGAGGDIRTGTLGAPFSRFPDGTIAQRPFGGGGFSAHLLRRRPNRSRLAAYAVRTGREARRSGSTTNGSSARSWTATADATD